MTRNYLVFVAAVLLMMAPRVEAQVVAPPWRLVQGLPTNGHIPNGIDISGDRLAVSSSRWVGEAWLQVYRRFQGAWTLEWQQIFAAPDGQQYNLVDLSLEGDTMAVVTSTVDGNVRYGLDVYQQSGAGWSRIFQTGISGYTRKSRPGVKISGDTIIVPDSSGVRVYDRSSVGWAYQRTLDAPDYFAADLDGDSVIVSYDETVKMYTRSDGVWTSQTLSAPFSGVSSNVVSIHGDRAVVGNGDNRAYVYERSEGTWTRVQSLTVDTRGGDKQHVLIDEHQIVLLSRYGNCETDRDSIPCGLPIRMYSFVHDGSSWIAGPRRTGSTDYEEILNAALENGQLVMGLYSPVTPDDAKDVQIYSNNAADGGPDFGIPSDSFGMAEVTLTGRFVNGSGGDPQWSYNGVIVPGLTATFRMPLGQSVATFSVPAYGVSDDVVVSVMLPTSAGAQGATGPTGAQGATGATGATGAKGATGAIGSIGERGATGADGATGATGAKGATGPKGATGSQGTAGEDGEDGPAGAKGTRGDRGPTGDWGPEGSQGPRGALGAKGPVGPAGAQGARGEPGLRGEIGSTGPVGPAGAQGPVGASGAIGAAGSAGPPGTRGDTGDSGATGPTGGPGASGVPGETGAPGPRGSLGPEGPRGPIGSAGVDGDAGDQGITGVRGATGLSGDVGEPGPAGAMGQTGETGVGGPAGPSGNRGPRGDAGASGAIGIEGPPEPPDLQSIVFMLDGDRPPAGYVAIGAFWEERVDVDGPGGQRPRRLRVVMWRKQ